MNATQCRRAARPQTVSGRSRSLAFAGFAAAAIVCGPVAGQDGPEDIGEWNDPPITGPLWGFDHDVFAMHAAHLPNGSILVWKIPPGEQPFLWDPVADTLTEMPTGFNVGCTGHAELPDGTLLLAGGIPPTTETKIFSFQGSPSVLGNW